MKTIRKTYALINKLIKREINYYRVKPTNLLLFLTYRCTSRCNTCSIWQIEVNQKELTLQEWKNFIDMIIDYKIEDIELFGGDALLRKDVLIPLIEYIKKRITPITYLTTNCNLMDEETANALVDAGIDVIYVSVDGIGELHDQIRGVSGSFKRVKKGLEYLIKARKGGKSPDIRVNCTISSLNIDGFGKVLQFSEDIGADVVAFEYLGEFPWESIRKSRIEDLEPQPYYIPQKTSLLLNREQAMLLKEKLKSIKKGKGRRAQIITKNIDFLKIENLVSGIFPNKRCYVCRYLITVDPYGNIIPCSFFNNYYLGNIREKHFDMIWNNGRHHNFMRYVDEGKIDMCKYCILGLERNSTILQSLRKAYFSYTKKGFDE